MAGHLQQTGGDLFIVYTCIHAVKLEIWVEVYAQHYAQGLPFIPRIFARCIVSIPNVVPLVITNSGIVIENNDVVHDVLAIQTGTICYSY